MTKEEIETRIGGLVEEFTFTSESQMGYVTECNYDKKASWGSGVWAENKETGKRICISSNYDTSG
jgi:hypothetical protein